MLLLQTLSQERHEFIPVDPCPTIPYRVAMRGADAGSSLSVCLDAHSLGEAVRKALLAAQWRGISVRAITFAAPLE